MEKPGSLDYSSADNQTEICRVVRSKEQAKDAYDKLSRWYDVIAGNFEKKYRDMGLQKLNAREGEKVLEIGFGTGHCILALAKSVGNSGKVYGIDISDGMLNIARSRIEKEGFLERVEFKRGDATELPFEGNFFDAIFMSFTLELFDTPEIPIVLQECKRVLRSGGRICVVSMSKKGKASLMVKIYEWSHRNFPKYADCRPIYVERSLIDAGFQIVDVTDIAPMKLPGEIVLAKKK